MNLASGIRLTNLDATRLTEFANELLRRAEVLADAGRTLMRLLNSARVVPSEAIPADVVTMNSKVILRIARPASAKRRVSSIPPTPIRRGQALGVFPSG
jgi:hypothetical protein